MYNNNIIKIHDILFNNKLLCNNILFNNDFVKITYTIFNFIKIHLKCNYIFI